MVRASSPVMMRWYLSTKTKTNHEKTLNKIKNNAESEKRVKQFVKESREKPHHVKLKKGFFSSIYV